MHLRAVIIDDEETGIETLKLLIERYTEGVKVVAEALRPTEGLKIIENYMPDIVFLDISMPEMTGFEMLEKLTWKNFNLIFTTAHQEHGLKALKINAIDYLLKPIDRNELNFAINKIRSRVAMKNDSSPGFNYTFLNSLNKYFTNKLAVTSKNGVEYVNPSDIIFLESKSNYTLISLNNSKTILTPKTLKDFEIQLCNDNLHFIRVHNSFIINSNNALRFLKDEETIIMSNDQKIPLAKSRRDVFFKWLQV